MYYEIEEDENGDQRVVVLKYNRLFDDSVHEAIVSDTEKRLTRTCEGAFFGSLDEFKSFYSYSNLNNVLDGVYESYDPRVRVAAWSLKRRTTATSSPESSTTAALISTLCTTAIHTT